jgi:hypothetical protein
MRRESEPCLDVIASEAKQSIARRGRKLDCFAALAMTISKTGSYPSDVIPREGWRPFRGWFSARRTAPLLRQLFRMFFARGPSFRHQQLHVISVKIADSSTGSAVAFAGTPLLPRR